MEKKARYAARQAGWVNRKQWRLRGRVLNNHDKKAFCYIKPAHEDIRSLPCGIECTVCNFRREGGLSIKAKLKMQWGIMGVVLSKG